MHIVSRFFFFYKNPLLFKVRFSGIYEFNKVKYHKTDFIVSDVFKSPRVVDKKGS